MGDSTSDSRTSLHTHAIGSVLVLALAATLWSLNGALIKLINEGGAGPDGITIAFYRSLIAGVFLWPLTRGKWQTLRRSEISGSLGSPSRFPRPEAVLCLVFFTLMTVCFVMATTMTEAASVTILQYTSTFWVFALSPMILKEKPRSSDVRILALALVGVVIVFSGGPSAGLVGLFVALASGLFFSLLTMMIRRLRDADSAAVTVFNNLGSAVLLLPVVLFAGGLAVSSRNLWLLLLLGVVQFGIPYYLYSLGLARVPAYQAALVTMLEPVLVPVWAFLAVGEKPPSATMIGGGVILVALVLFVNAARTARNTRTVDAGS